MNADLLQTEVQEFIRSNTQNDIIKLALAKNPFPNIPLSEIIGQIAARAKAKKKLPTWFNSSNIIYPSKVSIEQTSSEITAEFKAELVSGGTLADLTGGFGVDSFYFAKRMDKVIHCEQNVELHQLVRHNFKQIKAENISCFLGDSFDFLQQNTAPLDWIYIDPSRRNDAANRVFLLSDCEPNVAKLLPIYLKSANNILIKVAPLLDISLAISELIFIKEVHIVAVLNEVKELLFVIENDYTDAIKIKTANIKSDAAERFDFEYGSDVSAVISAPMHYLYEPNAAIMKSGGFDEIATQFGVNKLHKHTHLYTSEDFKINFPGRIFKIDKQLKYTKDDMKELRATKANITTRNFPDKVEEIRKRWKISDGGTSFIFFTTNNNDNKIALICSKV